jgi:hypothetical protein
MESWGKTRDGDVSVSAVRMADDRTQKEHLFNALRGLLCFNN